MQVRCVELSGVVIALKGPNTPTIRFVASLADVPKDPVSQDALGFAASAERLAEHFAPGLTVFTRSVRYYQLLAAGIRMAGEAGVPDSREVVLRLERTWALASYLADNAAGDRSGSGLLGITYVRSAAEPAKVSQGLDYPLFQRGSQGRAGALGLYRRSAHTLLLLDAGSVTSLGQRLSDTFVAAVGVAVVMAQYPTFATGAVARRRGGKRTGCERVLIVPRPVEVGLAWRRRSSPKRSLNGCEGFRSSTGTSSSASLPSPRATRPS